MAEFEAAPYGLIFDVSGAPWLFWDGAIYRLIGDVPEPLTEMTIQSVAVDVAGRVWFVAWFEGRAVLWMLVTVEGYWIQKRADFRR